jgi:hypothetical protein
VEVALTADDVGVVHAFYGTAIALFLFSLVRYGHQYYSARVSDFGSSLGRSFAAGDDRRPAAPRRRVTSFPVELRR